MITEETSSIPTFNYSSRVPQGSGAHLHNPHSEEVDERLAAARAEAAAVRRMNIQTKTRKIYQRSNAEFLLWLDETPAYAHLKNPEFGRDERGVVTISSLLSALESASNSDRERTVEPIRFEELTPSIFVTWLCSLRARSGPRVGQQPGQKTYNRHRSALKHLYTEYGKVGKR